MPPSFYIRFIIISNVLIVDCISSFR